MVSALIRESSMYAGASVGLLFSALALAAMTRLLVVAASVHRAEFIPWAPTALWLLAAMLLFWPVHRRSLALRQQPAHVQ